MSPPFGLLSIFDTSLYNQGLASEKGLLWNKNVIQLRILLMGVRLCFSMPIVRFDAHSFAGFSERIRSVI